LFVFFLIGISLGYFFSLFWLFFVLSLASAGLAIIFYQKQNIFLSDIAISLLFVFLAAVWIIPGLINRTDKFIGRNNSKVVLTIISLPQEGISRRSLLGQIKSIDGYPLKQIVRIIDYSHKLEYRKQYVLIGRVNKKYFSGRQFYMFWVKKGAIIEELSLSLPQKILRSVSLQLLEIVKHNCSDQGYRFIASTFFGRRELFRKEQGIFADAGISHLLAISGSNISLVSVAVFFILRFFGVKYRPGLLSALFLLFVYTFIVGAGAPVLRATLMSTVLALGFFLKRKINPLNPLGLAGLICLLIDPTSLFEASFQLSFLSVLALIMGFKYFPIKPAKTSIMSFLKYTFFASLYVTILITPLVGYYFGRVYFLSIFHNLILIPFFTLILTINFVLLIFSPLHFVADSLGQVLSLLIYFFLNFTESLSRIRFTYIDFYFSLLSAGIYYFILFVITRLIYQKFRRRRAVKTLPLAVNAAAVKE
jgi:ComEC/Rec2-related protein